MTRLRHALLGAAAAAVFGAGVAEAKQLRFAIGWPPNSIAHDAVETYASVAEEASGGELTVRVFPLSLLNFMEATSGVRDGIADITTILTPYFLAEFPRSNLLSELAALIELQEDAGPKAPMAFVGAITEYHMLHCPACVEEYAAQNHVYTAGASSPSYIFQCVTPIRTSEDLVGKRIRTGGAFWARWIQEMGATPVTLSANETFEALSQGVVDCTTNSASDLSNFSFIDVVSHLQLDVPGSIFASSISSMNRDTWRSLTPDQRTAAMRAGAALASHMTWNYWEEGIRNVERSRERGIEVLSASDELLAKSREFIARDLDGIVDLYKTRNGIADAQEVADAMRELVAKWTPLVADVETADELAEIYWNEIHSKIDVNSYGL